jgi:hypothetical protein
MFCRARRRIRRNRVRLRHPTHRFEGQPPAGCPPDGPSPRQRTWEPWTHQPARHAQKRGVSISPCRMALLLGHLKIICQPANDDVFERTQQRGVTLWCLAWRRHCIVDRLTHRTPMHAMGISQPADRYIIAVLTTNRLEQFHSRHLPLPPLRTSTRSPPRVGTGAPGGAKSNERNDPKWDQIRWAQPRGRAMTSLTGWSSAAFSKQIATGRDDWETTSDFEPLRFAIREFSE